MDGMGIHKQNPGTENRKKLGENWRVLKSIEHELEGTKWYDLERKDVKNLATESITTENLFTLIKLSDN